MLVVVVLLGLGWALWRAQAQVSSWLLSMLLHCPCLALCLLEQQLCCLLLMWRG